MAPRWAGLRGLFDRGRYVSDPHVQRVRDLADRHPSRRRLAQLDAGQRARRYARLEGRLFLREPRGLAPVAEHGA